MIKMKPILAVVAVLALSACKGEEHPRVFGEQSLGSSPASVLEVEPVLDTTEVKVVEATFDSEQVPQSHESTNALPREVLVPVDLTTEGLDQVIASVSEGGTGSQNELEVLEPVEEMFYVQLFASKDQANLTKILEGVKGRTEQPVHVVVIDDISKVLIGPYNDKLEAQGLILEMKLFPEYKDAFIANDKP